MYALKEIFLCNLKISARFQYIFDFLEDDLPDYIRQDARSKGTLVPDDEMIINFTDNYVF